MKISWLASILGLLLNIAVVKAQESKGYSMGSAITDFKLKNVDDRFISLANYSAQKGIIVVFTCNHCPFSKAYEDRILALDRKFSPQGYPVLAIMPNDPAAYTDDSFENMKIRARDKAYSFPYVIDETQSVARAFGASRTPQVYILKKSATSQRFTLEYTGAIDDNPQDATGVQKHYVDEVVTFLLAGQFTMSTANKTAMQAGTKAIGCGIKWK